MKPAKADPRRPRAPRRDLRLKRDPYHISRLAQVCARLKDVPTPVKLFPIIVDGKPLMEGGDQIHEVLCHETCRLAAIEAGLPMISVLICDPPADDEDADINRAEENAAREGLTSLEIGILMDRQQGRHSDWSQERVALSLGYNAIAGSRGLKVYRRFSPFPRLVDLILERRLCDSSAISIADLKDHPDMMHDLAMRACADEPGGRQKLKREAVKREVATILNAGKRERKPRRMSGRTPGGMAFTFASRDLDAMIGETETLLKALRKAQRYELPPDALGNLLS